MSKAVQDMLALFVSTFNGEIDTWQKRAYVRAIGDVSREVILEAADLLINEAAGGRKFYPMPTAPDVKGACAKVIEVKRAAAWLAAMKHCEHSGHWEEIDGKLTRCSCWKRGRLAMDAVAKQLSLPPSANEEVA